MNYDLFNGDADGICALHQLRLVDPQQTILITGVKRDINLLDKIDPQAGDQITMLDISFDKNRAAVEQALQAGAAIIYFDHHYAGDIPQENQLTTHIDTASDTCTSLIVNQYLQGCQPLWAIVGAYGDNLFHSAQQLATKFSLDAAQLQQLQQLGTMLNYNGYGTSIDDLHFHPAELYNAIQPHKEPFSFVYEEHVYQQLHEGYLQDLDQVTSIQPELQNDAIALIHLPDAPWARRVSGVYGNQLARENPDRAHAILTKMAEGDYRVSVRAPLNNREQADQLCRQFTTGGGRAAAAGINQLLAAEYDRFVDVFRNIYEN